MEGVKILGVGKYCPENVVTNFDLEKIVETSDEWIVKRTGIKERRISHGEGTVDIAYKAALNALENSNCSKDDIDLIIVATTSPDKIMPSTACSVQGLLDCKNAAAFDISAACSGFVYSLIIADSLIKSAGKKRALIIGAEVLSKIVDWTDRSTCVLFGDGAGAMVIEASDENSIISSCFASDGKLGEKTLVAAEINLNTPFVKSENIEKRYIEMKGGEVFKFAVSILPEIVNYVLDKGNEDLENIKYIVPHQANSRIIDELSLIHI